MRKVFEIEWDDTNKEVSADGIKTALDAFHNRIGLWFKNLTVTEIPSSCKGCIYKGIQENVAKLKKFVIKIKPCLTCVVTAKNNFTPTERQVNNG